MNKTAKKAIALLLAFLTFFSSVTPALAVIAYTYDANGNMSSDGTKCYVYNDANKLKQVKNCSNNQLIAEYVYDHEGNRIIEKEYENGTLKHTIYASDKEFEKKKLANGNIENTTYYVANDEVVAKKNPDGSKNYYHNDHLGSTATLTDQSGALLEETTYYPYGDIRAGGTKSDQLFTGQEKDATGLHYYNARYYDSHIQRFTQPDTMLPDPYDPQQLNRYSYVRNNPLKYKDPSGNIIETVVDVAFIAMDVADIANDPTNVWGYAALAADVGGMVLPGITGGRLAVKALQHSGAVGKAATQVAKHGDNVAKATTAVTKTATKVAKEATSQIHHLIPYANSRFQHATHELVKAAGATQKMLKNDPRNMVTLLNHAGPHSVQYHQAVQAIMDQSMRQVKAGKITALQGLQNTYDFILKGIGNGSIKPYNTKEVRILR